MISSWKCNFLVMYRETQLVFIGAISNEPSVNSGFLETTCTQ
jgi:hypothetical protein